MVARSFTADPNPKTIQRVVPHTAEWLAARAKFVEAWDAMTKLGLEAGYLEDEYEMGTVPTTLDHTYETIPNPEFDPDYQPPMVTVTIPITGREQTIITNFGDSR
jgi:hypothetical protein